MPTILLIDDDTTGLQTRACLFAHFGYKILTADNGYLGASLAVENDVDIVLVDYSMPLTGDVTAKTIKGYKPKLKVVMLSGFLEPDKALPNIDLFIQKGSMAADEMVRTVSQLIGYVLREAQSA